MIRIRVQHIPRGFSTSRRAGAELSPFHRSHSPGFLARGEFRQFAAPRSHLQGSNVR